MTFSSRLKIWLLASSTLALCACSTMQAVAPRRIDPPPASLVSPCERPAPLNDGATGQVLADYTLGWIGAWGCERGKREALLKVWPR